MPRKKIAQEHFDLLKQGEKTVPRYELDGMVIPFRLHSLYTQKNPSDPSESIEIRCIGTGPTILILEQEYQKQLQK